MAHAHLTWAEWTDQQAQQSTGAQPLAPALRGLEQKRSLTSIEHGATLRLTWPLSATQLPNARLTWSEWLDAQSRALAASRPAQGAFERAA
jgi:hypothetical protein